MDKDTPPFPYDRWRPGQRETAESLAEAIKNGNVFVLSAPTGFGKTAAIIYGLLKAEADKVLYLVRTRNEIIPVLRELQRFRVDKAVFLFSARRMCPLLEAETVDIEDFWSTCKILRLQGECRYYNGIANIDVDDIEEVIVKSSSPFQAIKLLGRLGLCPFFALKMLIGRSVFIVATYPYLFNKDIFTSTFEPLTYEDFHIVIDEAHSLLSIQSILEARLSQEDIRYALEEIKKYNLPVDVQRRLEKLHRIVSNFVLKSRGLQRVDLEQLREIMDEPGLWSDVAFEIRVARLREILESNSKKIVVRLGTTKIERFASLLFQDGVGTYVSVNSKGSKILIVTPLEPCTVTSEPLSRAKSVILSSGTMLPGDYIRNILCIKGKSIVVYDVEDRHMEASSFATRYTIVTLELTSKYLFRSNEMYTLYAQYIIEAYRLLRKSMLVVYPSYEFMSSIVRSLRNLARYEPLNLLVEDRDTVLDNVVDHVKKRKTLINAVAGGKLTEGVEFLGEDYSSLIGLVFIAGLPYPQPDDYLEDQLKALSSRLGIMNAKNYLYDVFAVIRTRQSIGRAQRSPKDRVIVVLGDYRFLRKNIREQLRIPINKAVSNIAEYVTIIARVAEQFGL